MRVRGMRSKLGRSSNVGDGCGVEVDAIPFLEERYDVQGVGFLAVIGAAPKDYIVHQDGREYIAKKPRREGPIECVTEYLIARIGTMLPLKVAEGRLVRLPTKAGEPADVRFLSRQFLDRSAEQLVHGSQLVAACFEMHEKELASQIPKGKEWHFYTVNLVDEILERYSPSKDQDHGLRNAFARMMAFDALIGANDRHAHNWGVIQSAIRQDAPIRFAPIFDTARGLFWNISEEKLVEIDADGRRDAAVQKYANGSDPLIGVEAPQRPNHFQVIEKMVASKGYRPPIYEILSAFRPDAVTRLLHKEFQRLLSRRRLEFIDALLRYRHATLLRAYQSGVRV